MEMEYSEEAIRVPAEEELKKQTEIMAEAAGFSIKVEPRDCAEPMATTAEDLFFEVAQEFESDFQYHKMEMKIHRFPAVLRDLGDRYIVPMAVAIGPYHHGLPRLQEMEKMKRVAAHHVIQDTSRSYEEIKETFLPVAIEAFRLYADDVVAGMEDAEFVDMMFRDACFLLQFICSFRSSDDNDEVVRSLRQFFFSNRSWIENDIMLLENQLPWIVVQTLMKFWPVDVEEFIKEFIVEMGKKFHIPDGPNHKDLKSKPVVLLDAHYTPPHLLGLLRFYKITVPEAVDRVASPADKSMLMSVPIGASQLAINGITLTASKATEFNDLKITKRFFFDEFFLAPLSLDGTTACWLVNMAAFEVWTAAGFSTGSEKTAVGSYLALLAMLTDCEEDVHKLRTNRLLRTELTDKQTLDFFDNIVEQMSPGRCYVEVLARIAECKRRRRWRITVHKFVSRNSKAIVTVLSIIGVLVGIFKTLYSVKQRQQ